MKATVTITIDGRDHTYTGEAEEIGFSSGGGGGVYAAVVIVTEGAGPNATGLAELICRSLKPVSVEEYWIAGNSESLRLLKTLP